MTKRTALIDDQTGEFTVSGIRCKVVPVDLIGIIRSLGYTTMRQSVEVDAAISAAAIDLSGLPGVPERETNLHLEAQILRGYQDGWNAALDAIGVK